MFYLLRYHYVDDMATLRQPHRAAHLSRLWEEADAGRVTLAGVAGDEGREAIIVWDVEEPSVVSAFAESDPYMVAGLITSYDVVPWRTVVGAQAQFPVRP